MAGGQRQCNKDFRGVSSLEIVGGIDIVVGQMYEISKWNIMRNASRILLATGVYDVCISTGSTCEVATMTTISIAETSEAEVVG